MQLMISESLQLKVNYFQLKDTLTGLFRVLPSPLAVNTPVVTLCKNST